jgi:hypothetical protein
MSHQIGNNKSDKQHSLLFYSPSQFKSNTPEGVYRLFHRKSSEIFEPVHALNDAMILIEQWNVSIIK